MKTQAHNTVASALSLLVNPVATNEAITTLQKTSYPFSATGLVHPASGLHLVRIPIGPHPLRYEPVHYSSSYLVQYHQRVFIGSKTRLVEYYACDPPTNNGNWNPGSKHYAGSIDSDTIAATVFNRPFQFDEIDFLTPSGKIHLTNNQMQPLDAADLQNLFDSATFYAPDLNGIKNQMAKLLIRIMNRKGHIMAKIKKTADVPLTIALDKGQDDLIYVESSGSKTFHETETNNITLILSALLTMVPGDQIEMSAKIKLGAENFAQSGDLTINPNDIKLTYKALKSEVCYPDCPKLPSSWLEGLLSFTQS